MLLTTFEILLTIVTSLLALYLRGGWRPRTVAACMVCVAVVWYLTYAPIHELSHAGATMLAGGSVSKSSSSRASGRARSPSPG